MRLTEHTRWGRQAGTGQDWVRRGSSRSAGGTFPGIAGRPGDKVVDSRTDGTSERLEVSRPPHMGSASHTVPRGKIPARITMVPAALGWRPLRTLVVCTAGNPIIASVGVPVWQPLPGAIRPVLAEREEGWEWVADGTCMAWPGHGLPRPGGMEPIRIARVIALLGLVSTR